MSYPYTTACPTCADKLRKHYYLIEVPNSERVGRCRWCQKMLRVEQYEYSPHRRPKPRKQDGGGERAKYSQ